MFCNGATCLRQSHETEPRGRTVRPEKLPARPEASDHMRAKLLAHHYSGLLMSCFEAAVKTVWDLDGGLHASPVDVAGQGGQTRRV